MNLSVLKLKKNQEIIIVLSLILCFASFLIFFPQVRNMIIDVGEKLNGAPLSRDIWNERFLKYEISFLTVFCSYLIFTVPLFFSINLQSKNDERIHYICLWFFLIALCIIHLFAFPSWDDDYFCKALDNKSLFEFLKNRYTNWSSRLLIEALLVNIYSLHLGLWRFFDIAAVILIAECMIFITATQKKYVWFVYAVLILFSDYNSFLKFAPATITLNYLWPLACAMPSFVIAKKIFERLPILKWEIVVSSVMLLFATNQEQLAALLFGLNISFLLFRLVRNHKFEKIDLFFVLNIAICLISLAFILACPGNAIRFEISEKVCLPEYSSLSFLEKCQIGIMLIFSYYFSLRDSLGKMVFVIIPLFAMLSVVFFSKKNIKSFTLQILLDIFVCVCFAFRKIKSDFLFFNIKLAPFSTFSSKVIGIECFVFILIFICLLYQIFSVMDKKASGLFNVFLMCAGFCSAFIMIFSPTVYASGTRPYLFMSNIIFFIVFRIFFDYMNLKKLEYKNTID